jgi:hypothetical protein
MVDALVLGTSVLRHVGSSPTGGISSFLIFNHDYVIYFFLFQTKKKKNDTVLFEKTLFLVVS